MKTAVHTLRFSFWKNKTVFCEKTIAVTGEKWYFIYSKMRGGRTVASMLKIDIRRAKILEKLKQQGTVSVAQLALELGATPVTIRSDLDALEAEGSLVRVQGGAVPLQRSQGRSAGGETVLANEKQAIAHAVAELVRDGDTLFINSGTTMLAVANALRIRKNLNIVTNSLEVASELGTVPGFRVILLGGEVNARYGFTYGSDAQEQLSHYRADKAIMSLDGIEPEAGLTTYHAEEATINRMVIARAGQLIVAADHTKVGRTGFFRFHPLGQEILLVTDRQVSEEAVAALEQAQVTVITAK